MLLSDLNSLTLFQNENGKEQIYSSPLQKEAGKHEQGMPLKTPLLPTCGRLSSAL